MCRTMTERVNKVCEVEEGQGINKLLYFIQYNFVCLFVFGFGQRVAWTNFQL